MKKKKQLVIVFVVGVILGMGIMWGIPNISGIIPIGSSNTHDDMEYIYNKYSKVEDLYKHIENEYYTDIDDEQLMDGIYKGLFEGLNDDYSLYMTKEEYKEWNTEVSGEFSGIGITFFKNDKSEFEIISVMDDTPAERAGLKPGDLIKAVDGKTYKDISEVSAAVKGETGTKVKITYIRGNEEKTVPISREKIKMESVKSEYKEGNIGYIRVSSFIETTAEDFESALSDMEEKNVKGIVIDIRNNGGGLVEAGLKVADMLLGDCKIVCYLDNKGEKTYSYSNKSKTALPYVLLVDQGSASTSEILAAAIQDNKGGKVVGTKTFGKGIIQSTTKFKDGSAAKLTTMQYLSPKGKKIHKAGVTPDYKVELKDNDKTDYQLNKALELLKQ